MSGTAVEYAAEDALSDFLSSEPLPDLPKLALEPG